MIDFFQEGIYNAHQERLPRRVERLYVRRRKIQQQRIPLCPTTAETLPAEIIPWDEAKHIYKTALARGNAGFVHPAFVCFYLDDQKFDGLHGIWHDSTHALKILRHFAGAITPGFSTYQDFPEPIKIYNTYRMRAFGYWLGRNGISVINNVRWGTPESWRYCWDGIPENSIVCIGTVGGSPKKHAFYGRIKSNDSGWKEGDKDE